MMDNAAKESVKGLVMGFGHFIREYGVLPLAIGVVIANAVNDLTKATVEGLIAPFISLISPTRLQDIQFHVHGAVFKIGLVLNSLLNFLTVALIVYVVAKVILRNEELLRKK